MSRERRAGHTGTISTPAPGLRESSSLATIPTHREALSLAHSLLADQGTRLAHVRTAGLVAHRLGVLFDAEDAAVLVAAATLHDIGYSPRIAHRGFHPLDGALFLRAEGYPDRLAALVAHHSLARLTIPPAMALELEQAFPREDCLLTDALAYADMHSAPDGRLVRAEVRLDGIASRHPDRGEAQRAGPLRAAIARVGHALLVAQAQAVPLPRGSDGDPLATVRVPTAVLAAFETWWRAETRYRIAWREFTEALPAEADRQRERALHLASLRGRADMRRDRYFRLVLG